MKILTAESINEERDSALKSAMELMDNAQTFIVIAENREGRFDVAKYGYSYLEVIGAMDVAKISIVNSVS